MVVVKERAMRPEKRAMRPVEAHTERFDALRVAMGTVACNGQIGRMRWAFECMGVAERAIDRVTTKDNKAELADVFTHLCPPTTFYGLHPFVYAAHVEEQLQRAMNFTFTSASKRASIFEQGTRAEAMVALQASTLLAPPKRPYAALYEILFVEIFGNINGVDAVKAREGFQYPAQFDELLDEARKAGAKVR